MHPAPTVAPKAKAIMPKTAVAAAVSTKTKSTKPVRIDKIERAASNRARPFFISLKGRD